MRLVTRAELGRHLGVTTNAVTIACRERIADACVGQRVDIDHASVQAWIRKRRRGQSELDAEPSPGAQEALYTRPSADQNSVPRTPDGIEDVHGFEHLTLREIVSRWGGMSVHSDWLDMRRKQTQIRERELKNYELEGKLIPREAVRVHVFGIIDGAFRRLLQDSPKTIARRVYAMAKAGEDVGKAEELVRDSMTSVLQPLKDSAVRALREARSAPREDDAGDGTTEPGPVLPPRARRK